MPPLTLFSFVISHRNATARTPKLLRSMTVCCASRPECKKVMATSAPAWAMASAVARPRRRAPPVIRTVFPASGFSSALSIDGNCIVIDVHVGTARRGFNHIAAISAHTFVLEQTHHNCYTHSHVGPSPSRGLLPQRMSSLRDRQRDPQQFAAPRRLHLAGRRRRQRRATAPPVHRRSPGRLHRRPQSLQVPHG